VLIDGLGARQLSWRHSNLAGEAVFRAKEDCDVRSTQMMNRKRCAYCRGQGSAPGLGGPSAPEPCPVCNQRGYNLVPSDAVLCSLCQGSGRVPAGGGSWKSCPECGGIGSRW